MARKSTSRPDTTSTAAYSASQPLFDAIRDACDQIDEQKQHLTAAKDAVQKLHVKLPSEHTGIERVTRADYIETLVKSWRQATNSYQLIFAELCKLTAPDPATGRGEQEDYDAFKRIQETALNANTVSLRYVINQPKPKAQEKRKASPSTDVENDAISAKKAKKAADIEQKIKEAKPTALMPPPPKRPAPEGSSPTPSAPRPIKRARTTEIDTTVTAKAAEPPTTSRELNKRNRRRQRNADKANGTAKKEVPATLQPTNYPTPAVESAPQQVQYEDVSAEVAARLAAKEEKKRAKKEAKKRKRDSLGSAVLEAEVGREKDAIEARVRELKDKPAKKRSKSATGEAVRAGEVELPERGKRRGELVDEAGKGEVNGEGRKKRKKAKE